MNTSPKLSDKKYRLMFTLIALAIWCFSIGILFLIPEKYHSHYAFSLAVVFLLDALLLPRLKKWRVTEDEKRTYPLFPLMGLLLILVASILLYINIEPGVWIFSFILGTDILTSGVVFQYLRNRHTIP
jgi:hypothetical protein